MPCCGISTVASSIPKMSGGMPSRSRPRSSAAFAGNLMAPCGRCQAHRLQVDTVMKSGWQQHLSLLPVSAQCTPTGLRIPQTCSQKLHHDYNAWSVH